MRNTHWGWRSLLPGRSPSWGWRPIPIGTDGGGGSRMTRGRLYRRTTLSRAYALGIDPKRHLDDNN